jgi:hypothetical protein
MITLYIMGNIQNKAQKAWEKFEEKVSVQVEKV